MLESFITAFVIYFVVVDPIGNAPIFLAVTTHLDKTRKARVALEGTAVATIIMLFFAICGSWILGYLNISEAAFKIAGGLILFTVALDMLTSRRQTRKEQNTARDSDAGAPPPALGESDNVAIFPLAIPLLAGPAAIMSVMVVSGIILSLTVLAERIIDPRAANVFSRITAIILAALSVQYVIDGVTLLGFIAS
jgi:multiple antibiotic resistance protein